MSADAYNQDGQDILNELPLKNISYLQAINRLLDYESANSFLTDNSLLFFTIVSEHSDTIMEEINTSALFETYKTMMYTSDMICMQEAHQHQMSFGKYQAFLELSKYDESVTVEDCHSMTMGEIHNRIEGCKGHTGTTHDQGHTGGGHHCGNGH